MLMLSPTPVEVRLYGSRMKPRESADVLADVLTTAEMHACLAQLSDADLWRLRKIARHYAGRSVMSADDIMAEALDRALDGLVSETSPNLMLNNHCSICEFRQQCHTQAVQEDNLSLIRGIGEKEIKGYGRKGLFTLTQLAYTFRPRRNPKQPDGLSKQRNHSLGLNSTNLNGPVPTGRCRICAGGTWHGYPGTSPTPATRWTRAAGRPVRAECRRRARRQTRTRRQFAGRQRPPRQVCLQAMQFSVLTKMAPQLVSRFSAGLQA
jgi:hypothetical protein